MTAAGAAYHASRGQTVIALHDTTGGACSCGEDCGRSAGKHPRARSGWQNTQYRPADVLAAAWAPPAANVGLVQGLTTWTVDWDPRNDPGHATYARLAPLLGDPRRRTPNGGLHWEFELDPATRALLTTETCTALKKAHPGVDWLAEGRQVVAWPSVTLNGPYVELRHDAPPATPGEIFALLSASFVAAPPPVVAVAEVAFSGDPRQYDNYTIAASAGILADLANEPMGYTEGVWSLTCRLIELANSSWCALSVVAAERGYAAAWDAYDLKHHGTVDAKQRSANWKRALKHVAGRGLPVPSPPVEAAVTPAPTTRLKLTRASSIKPRRVKWLWHNRIPLGEITLVAGREGVGKSTYLADLAAQVTRGTAKGEYTEPRAVLYAAQEDSWAHTIVPRLMAAGADMDLVYQVESHEDRGLVLPLDCESLAEAALEVNASTIMCDPIISLIDEKLSTDRSRELRQALEPLRRSAERSFVSVLGLVHFNKSDGDVLTKIAGSRGWVEVARAAIAIARDDEAKHNVLSQVKNNLGRSDLKNWTYTIQERPVETDEGVALTGCVVWGDHTDTHAEDLLKKHSPRNEHKVPEVGITEFVSAQYAATQRDVPRAAIVGYFGAASAATVDRAIKKCVENGSLVQVRVGLFTPRSSS